MNFKNQVNEISKYRLNNNTFSKRAYVRQRYVTEKQVIENSLVEYGVESSIIRTDNDLKIIEIIDIINGIYSGFSGKIENQGNPNVISDTIIIPKIINPDTFKIELNDTGNNKMGIFNGWEEYSYFTEPGNISNYGLYLPRTFWEGGSKRFINNYVLNSASLTLNKAITIFNTLTDNRKVINILNTLINDLNLITKLMLDNFETLELYVKTSTGFNKYNPVTDSLSSFKTGKTFLYGFLNRQINKFNDLKTKIVPNVPEDVIPAGTSTTTDIFNDNKLIIEFTKNKFDKLKPDFSSFLYETEVNPSPDGKSIVKIPKENSFVFVSPLSPTSYFVNLASEYDEVRVNIDTDLSLKIKDFLVNIKTDEANITTGKNEDQGIILNRTELTTGLIEDITLQSSVNNNSIKLYDTDKIEINGKNGKIGIGLIGDNGTKTPYDSDILLMESEKTELNNLITGLIKFIKDAKQSYTVFTDTEIVGYKLSEIITPLFTTIKTNNYSLNNITNYKEYNQKSIDVFKQLEELKKLMINISWDNRLAGSSFKKPVDFIKYNNKVKDIQELTSLDIGNLISNSVVGSVSPLRDDRKTSNLDGINNSNFFSRFFTFLLDNNLSKYKPTIESLINKTIYYSKYTRERTPLDEYCSNEEGASIIAFYFINQYTILSYGLNNLKNLQSEYILNNKPSYNVSIGSILSNLTNILNGSLKSFTINPSGTPPNILQPSIPDDIFNNKMSEFNNNIKELFIL